MVRKLQFGLVPKSLPSTNSLTGLMTSQNDTIKKSSTPQKKWTVLLFLGSMSSSVGGTKN